MLIIGCVCFGISCGDPGTIDTQQVDQDPDPKPDPDANPDPNSGLLPLALPKDTQISTHMGGFYCYVDAVLKKTYCKGANGKGQLGNGQSQDSSVPVEVALPNGVENFVKVQVGFEHACALSDQGQIYCWGSGAYGKLGSNLNINAQAVTPQRVEKPAEVEHFVDLVVAYHHSCGQDQSGQLYCWGKGDRGQMGNGKAQESNPSLQKVNAPNPDELTETLIRLQKGQGDFTCAMSNKDQTYCWGGNSQGSFLENGNLLYASPKALEFYVYEEDYYGVPVQIPFDVSFKSVQAGLLHMCGESLDGKFYCWGDDTFGQRGDGRATSNHGVIDYIFPNQVVPPIGEFNILKKFPGAHHNCAWTDNQDLRCFVKDGPPLSDGISFPYTLYGKAIIDLGGAILHDFQPGTPNVGITTDNEVIEVTIPDPQF